MNISTLRNYLACLCLGGVFSSTPAMAIVISNNSLLGIVDPSEPSAGVTEADQINFLVTGYNSSSTPRNLGDNPADSGTESYILSPGTLVPAGPLPSAVLAFKNDNANTTVSAGGFNFDYVLGKYGTDSYVFYIGNVNLSDNQVTLPASQASGSLSHSTFMNRTNRTIITNTPVPDGGATLALLGLSLGTLGFVSRKMRK